MPPPRVDYFAGIAAPVRRFLAAALAAALLFQMALLVGPQAMDLAAWGFPPIQSEEEESDGSEELRHEAQPHPLRRIARANLADGPCRLESWRGPKAEPLETPTCSAAALRAPRKDLPIPLRC